MLAYAGRSPIWPASPPSSPILIQPCLITPSLIFLRTSGTLKAAIAIKYFNHRLCLFLPAAPSDSPMQLPLYFAIEAPPHQVVPALARATRELGGVWGQRAAGRAILWQLREGGFTSLPLALRLAPTNQDEQCRLAVEAPGAANPNGSLLFTVEKVVQSLRRQGLSVAPTEGEAPTAPSALFVSPDTAPYTALVPPLETVLKHYGLHLHHTAAQRPVTHEVRHAVEGAELVIGPWETAQGRIALQGARTRGRSTLALAPPGTAVPEWIDATATYGATRADFLANLDAALRAREAPAPLPASRALFDTPPPMPALAPEPEPLPPGEDEPETVVPEPRRARSYNAPPRPEPAPPPAQDEPVVTDAAPEPSPPTEPVESSPAAPLPAPLEPDLQPDLAERAAVYREVAQDSAASPEQRFHAARVLLASGEREEAAQVLGAVVAAPEAGDLADEALDLLGTMGATARPTLWRVDARLEIASRLIGIARQLARVGDPQTALFRLERLAHHEDEAIRLAALQTMAEAGGAALSRFQALAARAHDPKVRLEAARWLHQQGESPEQVSKTFVALASQSDRVDVAQAAVELLGSFEADAAREPLLAIAQHALSAEARLSAAEVISRHGDTSAARAILLTLAQGTDDLAAGAALDVLASTPDTATADTQRLMNTAILRSVRRRAALLLGQPHQPEPIQQAAARVLLALDRPNLARPILARLASTAEDLDIRRWAAYHLASIGEETVDEVRAAFARAEDPVIGQHLAEALLAHSRLPEDRHRAAIWLADHSNLPRAVEVLGDLALSARVPGSDAVRATDDLNRYAGRWAGAARALATLASESPHPAVRARALDLLLREHPSELPLALLLDLAVTGSIGATDRAPVIQQLNALAEPAVTRIVERLAADDTDTEGRWHLLHLMNELPDRAVGPALLQLSATAPQNRIRYIAAEQLVARGQPRAGYAALATIAIDDPDWMLRERALYELVQGLPETRPLVQSIITRTRYQDTYRLARELLTNHSPTPARRVNNWLDDLALRWHAWVATLPLGWLDRLLGRGSRQE